VAQPALPHPRFTNDAHDGAPAVECRDERCLERRQLIPAANEAREPTRARDIQPRPQSARTLEPEYTRGLAHALELERAQVSQGEKAADKPRRVLGQVGVPGLGNRLHPLRQTHRVTDRRVVERQIVSDRPHHHLARVQPHPHREAETPLTTQLGGIRGELVTEMQRGVARAPRVVLVGDRGAEERHDPIARELIHRAIEAVDPVAQQREEAVHDPLPGLGIDRLGQRHRAGHIGEQHRHVFAFPRQPALPGANLLHHVLGRVGARNALGPEPLPARVAERRTLRVGVPARGAVHRAPSATGPDDNGGCERIPIATPTLPHRQLSPRDPATTS
jgi:hypothetical protein